MTPKRYVWMTTAVAIAITLFAAAETRAQFGDGICQPNSAEATNRQCAVLGSYALEVVPSDGEFPVTGTCQVNGQPVACSFWAYRFSGPASGDNQLNLLIPANVAIYPNQLYAPTNTVYGGCQQLYAPGAGDPTTGFGKGIITDKVCRVALNIDAGPGTPNLVLATQLSAAAPLPVQLKSGRSIYFDDVLGPSGGTVPKVAATTQQITQIGGEALTIETNQTGQVVAASATTGPVTIIPPGFAVLCTPVDPTNAYPNNFPAQYNCGPITENTDGTNIQAGEHTYCYNRRSDGTLLKWCCILPCP
jgi:hypothetical protein